MILLIHAHPYPKHSRAGTALLGHLQGVSDLAIHALYDRYPDFDIDVEREQAALRAARLVVWMHPLYWYSVPGLLKHWFDVVLTRGFAYGRDGAVLAGKPCLWVTTTGGGDEAYGPGGVHERPFADFIAPVEQTARFCRMRWLEPFVVHGAHAVSDAELAEAGLALRRRLEAEAAHEPSDAKEHA